MARREFLNVTPVVIEEDEVKTEWSYLTYANCVWLNL